MEDEKAILYRKAEIKWGQHLQLIQTIEEMAELTKELCKARKSSENKNKDQIAEEIADVQIMLEQITYFFDIVYNVGTWKKKKLDRLAKILE